MSSLPHRSKLPLPDSHKMPIDSPKLAPLPFSNMPPSPKLLPLPSNSFPGFRVIDSPKLLPLPDSNMAIDSPKLLPLTDYNKPIDSPKLAPLPFSNTIDSPKLLPLPFLSPVPELTASNSQSKSGSRRKSDIKKKEFASSSGRKSISTPPIKRTLDDPKHFTVSNQLTHLLPVSDCLVSSSRLFMNC